MARIFMSSDPLFTSESEQHSNLRWFTDLLSRPIEQATGIAPVPFVGSTTGASSFDRREFFRLSRIALDPEATQFFYRHAEVTQASLDYLSECLGSDALIIGYELSESTRAIFSRMGVTYVDIWLHPIRFLDDIIFAFSSNQPDVFERLSGHSLDPEVYHLYGTRAKIATYKGYHRVRTDVVPDSALFVGQTLKDKAVCRDTDGKMLTLLDFKEEFEKAGAKYSRVYYSRHPYVKHGDEEILRYVDACDFAERIDAPAYHLLANPGLRYVFSVSSSVVHEAKYFGKDTKFLYRPVIDLDLRFDPRCYASVFQEFVSGHFWSDVLSPVVETRECARAVFLSEKDQLRDMLGFYWSYRHVDKAEHVRDRLATVESRLRALDPVRKTRPGTRSLVALKESTPDPLVVMKGLESQLRSHDVISFDLFDTLVFRPFRKPEDLFDLLEAPVAAATAGRVRGFKEIRLKARGWVASPAHGEEVVLRERYAAIGERFSLSSEQVARLQEIEEEAELSVLRPRPAGMQLFREALATGKRVVIVSDTFFERPFIEDLLARVEISGQDRVFLSSETGKLKATGAMFDHLVEELGVKPSAILHIGDNVVADVERARERGIAALLLDRTVDAFDAHCLAADTLRKGEGSWGSLRHGLAANHIADIPGAISTPSFVGGTIEQMGYAIVGPIFFAFARWVLESALRDGVEHLYFLARDGHVIMKAYEVIARHYPDAPTASYLYASRRGVAVPALRSAEDVVALLEVNYTATELGEFLHHRFGLPEDEIDTEVLSRHGFDGTDVLVSPREHADSLRALLEELTPQILRRAEEERAVYLDYLEREAFAPHSKKRAVVDIGHRGTMQNCLSRLVEDDSIGGYYFALFSNVPMIRELGMEAEGFLGDAVDQAPAHPYVRFILMFELLFLNDEGSFVRMERRDDVFEPIQRQLDGEADRIRFSREVQSAALSFVEDASDVMGPRLGELTIDADEVIAPYVAMLSAPSRLDANPFLGMPFENVYSGRGVAHVISPSAAKGRGGSSLWLEGSRVLAKRTSRSQSLLIGLVRIANRFGWISDQKMSKLERSPRRFFSDSRSGWVRLLARLFPH